MGTGTGMGKERGVTPERPRWSNTLVGSPDRPARSRSTRGGRAGKGGDMGESDDGGTAPNPEATAAAHAAQAAAAAAERRAQEYEAANVAAGTSKGAAAASAAAAAKEAAAARRHYLSSNVISGPEGQPRRQAMLGEAGGAGEEEDLQLLEARMLQWSYLNVRAEAAFDAQEHRARVVLHGGYQAVEELKLQQHAEQLQLAHAKYCSELDAVLDLFDSSLMPLGDLVPSLVAHHHRLSKAVEVTTHQLPTQGINTAEDPQKLAWALAASARLLDQLNTTVEVCMPGLQPYAEGLSKLDQTTREELQSLSQCRELLGEIVAMETHERSLRIQQKQTERLFANEARKQKMAGLSTQAVGPAAVDLN